MQSAVLFPSTAPPDRLEHDMLASPRAAVGKSLRSREAAVGDGTRLEQPPR